MLRHAPVRAAVGLAVGFVAAAGTFLVVDRYGSDDESTSVVVVHEQIDYDGFCAANFDGARAMRLGDGATDWMCGRRVDGLWSPTTVDHAALCRWQYGAGSEPRLRPQATAFDWICID